MEWLVVWGASQVAWSIFRPILEDLAKDVVKDTAKSYVGKWFKSVFSVVYSQSLAKATGFALKELLELIENELLDADLTKEQIRGLIPAVKQFIQQEAVGQAIESLFLKPEHLFDSGTFAKA